VRLREGRYFEPILNYMRTGELLIPPSMPKSAVLAEADFYCITPGAPCLPPPTRPLFCRAPCVWPRAGWWLTTHPPTHPSVRVLCVVVVCRGCVCRGRGRVRLQWWRACSSRRVTRAGASCSTPSSARGMTSTRSPSSCPWRTTSSPPSRTDQSRDGASRHGLEYPPPPMLLGHPATPLTRGVCVSLVCRVCVTCHACVCRVSCVSLVVSLVVCSGGRRMDAGLQG
jgi:hypothetical protein